MGKYWCFTLLCNSWHQLHHTNKACQLAVWFSFTCRLSLFSTLKNNATVLSFINVFKYLVINSLIFQSNTTELVPSVNSEWLQIIMFCWKLPRETTGWVGWAYFAEHTRIFFKSGDPFCNIQDSHLVLQQTLQVTRLSSQTRYFGLPFSVPLKSSLQDIIVCVFPSVFSCAFLDF